MTRMTASLLTLVLLAPAVSAAPAAPDRAKEKLEAMKKKLPEVVQEWGEVNAGKFGQGHAKLRLIRQVGPTVAKVNVLVWSAQSGTRDGVAVTIFLSYYDGYWTSTRFEGGWGEGGNQPAENAVRVLMQAIDELGEK